MAAAYSTGEPRPAEPAPSAPEADGVVIEYTPIAAGPDGRMLLAHDRHRLERALLQDVAVNRVLRSPEPAPDIAPLATIDSATLQRLRRPARVARVRRWVVYSAAAALPFFTAALLGLVGRWLGVIPTVGETLGDVVATAGGTLGGLPLAVIITSLPSVWLVRRAHRSGRDHPWPATRRTASDLKPVELRDDLGAFAADVDELLGDLAGILGGNPRASGERARRLADRFDRLGRLAARHGVASVSAFAADAAEQFRRAARPPRRLLPFLAGRRPSVPVAAVLAPYGPGSAAASGALLPPALGVLGGLSLAALAFFAAGVFWLNADEALFVRANELVAFPSSATVLDIRRGFEGPSDPGAGTVSIVQRPGLFWGWPRPLADRQLLALERRSVPVTTAFPTGGTPEDIEVDFRYDISDLKFFVVRMAPVDMADELIGDLLESGLALFLRAQRDQFVQQAGAGNDAAVNQQLRSQMGTLLNRFVSDFNLAAAAGDLGIELEPRPDFRFVRP